MTEGSEASEPDRPAARDEHDEPREPVDGVFRRAPRFGRFIGTGAALGVLAAAVASVSLPDPPHYSGRAIAGYLIAIGLLLGGVLGAGAAVIADRQRR